MVKEIEPAIEFYTKFLGFLLKQQNKPYFAMVSHGNLELILSTPFGPRSRPIELAGQTFTIIKHYKRIHGRTDPDGQTLAILEIVGSSGVRYREEFMYAVERNAFADTCDVSVQPLEGSNGKGLLLDRGCDPSAPLSGGPWQVLGLVAGAIVPIGKPIVAEGEFGHFVPGAVTRIGAATRILPDTLRIRVWTGYFFAEVPLRVDWMQRQVAFAQQCFYQTGQGLKEEGCEVPVDGIDRAPADRDLTFVRLFTESRESFGVPEHIVVRRDSKVEFLAAKVLVKRQDVQDATTIGVADDIWLKVRIDGSEGWIHTVEDFNALGLHQPG